VNGTQYGFMDIVLVILDGSSRDLGTAFKLLETVVLKSIQSDRVIVAINQADLAMKGRYWNSALNKPEKELSKFLDEKANSVVDRLREATGLRVSKPVCYSALYGYNMEALMDHVINHFPVNRRILS
jgi:predicted GTPase